VGGELNADLQAKVASSEATATSTKEKLAAALADVASSKAGSRISPRPEQFMF
jgi:hypothetical protein